MGACKERIGSWPCSQSYKMWQWRGHSVCVCAGSDEPAVSCVTTSGALIRLWGVSASSSFRLQVITLPTVFSSRSRSSDMSVAKVSGWYVLEGAGVSVSVVVSALKPISWSGRVCGLRLFVKCIELTWGLKAARLASLLRPPKPKRVVFMPDVSYEAWSMSSPFLTRRYMCVTTTARLATMRDTAHWIIHWSANGFAAEE
jgi:hypothetical protein